MLENIDDFLPITVFAAITLFVLKELVEARRRQIANRNIKKVLVALIGSELKGNYKALSLNINVFNLTASYLKGENVKCEFHSSLAGDDYCVIKKVDYELQSPIPILKTNRFESLVEKIVELDQTLFDYINEAYNQIALVNRARDIVVSILSGSKNQQELDYANYILNLIEVESEKIKAAVSKAYLELTGEKI